jgi:hypothetical protein
MNAHPKNCSLTGFDDKYSASLALSLPESRVLSLAGLRELEIAGEEGDGYGVERRYQLATNKGYENFAKRKKAGFFLPK